jgi:hypothetical protein
MAHCSCCELGDDGCCIWSIVGFNLSWSGDARFADLSAITSLHDRRHTDGSILKNDEGVNVIYPFNPKSSLFVLPLTKDGLDVSGLEPGY